MSTYQVIVVGGGHAGAEAAAASVRAGARTALVTMTVNRIAEMSCNPAIGGLAKGQIVREVDAMDGLMGRVSDMAGIQFRVLNASKGPAVRAPRAQEDKVLYRNLMQQELLAIEGLDIIEAEVLGLKVKKDKVTGVITDQGEIFAETVVITGGTFLNGLTHVGQVRERAGRFGERASIGLSEQLTEMGFDIGRMKTGTPPRVHRDSIDFSVLDEQPGDPRPTPFSFMSAPINIDQIVCHIAFTNENVHSIIGDNISASPLYSGQILGRGPRYCPSIEDKVVKFPDKERHQLFLEPETRDGESIYVNGISTSMPEEVQYKFIQQIPGLENARFIRPGYAIEYDMIDPRVLKQTLESKQIDGLFFCGQINGTSGYEEAAGQGLVAGANAALKILQKEPLIADRENSYIGVMIDDLITHGADEPYRMFTSRADNRLFLRADNADQRLTGIGREAGVVADARWISYQKKMDKMNVVRSELSALNFHSVEQIRGLGIEMLGGLKKNTTALEFLKRPEIGLLDLLPVCEKIDELSREECISIETREKYAGYLDRIETHRQKVRSQEGKEIPENIDYRKVPGLSLEMRDRLNDVKPESVGQASRIPGITPAAVAALSIYLVRLEQGAVR